MADEVSLKIRAAIETSGEERLANTQKALEDIKKLDEKPQSSKQTPNQADNLQNKTDNSHSKATNEYLKQVDSITKGFSMLAKSIENPIMLLGMFKEGLFNAARYTAQKADQLQVSPKNGKSSNKDGDQNDENPVGKEEKANPVEQRLTIPTDLKQALKEKDKSSEKKNDEEKRLSVPKNGKLSDKTPGDTNENPIDKDEKEDPVEQRLTIPTDLKNALKEKNKASSEKDDDEKRLSVPKNAETEKASNLPTDTMDEKDNLQNTMLGDLVGSFAKSLGVVGGALAGVAAVAIAVDKGLKKMNEATLAAGERMAMLQTTGNVAAANLDEYNNSLGGIILNNIPIIGELMKMGKTKDVADWTAYQPFAKLIPSLLDYKYKTGSEGSGADVAKKVTDKTGIETGYDFATRFGIMNKMSEYTGKDGKDAEVTKELLSNARALGLDPDMLVDLVGNELRYDKDNKVSFASNNNDIMTSIQKTATDTGLDRSRYKELIRGFDEIIKKQISIGVPVKVENVSDMAGILGQAGDTWKGEQGLQIQMSMSDRLRSAGNLTSDEDVALMQWTMGENESYHDWRLEMDKGLTEGRFETMSQRFIKETGEDKVTGNLRLMNAFGLSSYTQADELRKLMIKMNGTDPESGEKLNNTKKEEAQVEFQKKMNEIKDGERPEELTYLENVNTTMEQTQTQVTGRLDSILGVLRTSLNKELKETYSKADKHSRKAFENNAKMAFSHAETRIKTDNRDSTFDLSKKIDFDYLKRSIFVEADKDANGKLDREEREAANQKMEETLDLIAKYFSSTKTATKDKVEELMQELINKIGEGIMIQ